MFVLMIQLLLGLSPKIGQVSIPKVKKYVP